ncbi:OLC1v1012113C1 [Oldenlandia corymbosa var. corymbosa]|uniref:OLC1v1012113C1 n=1 Tax=Oldenlandia corymbosa var. corymbosa TaxID=529605 RepID=A0AAV1DYD6_OLDCO|nr:OLC1v1012113C1 [Oldenlandia corymbosa var. corymbosa]
MDIWVVAAAAGAGYVAQHCKSLVKGRHSFSESSCRSHSIRTESSSSITQQVKDNKSCPGSTVHSFRHDEETCSDMPMLSRATSLGKEASSSYLECLTHEASTDCSNPCSCSGSNLVPGIPSYEVRYCGDVGGSDRDYSMLPSTREVVKYGFKRKKSSLRSRQANAKLLQPVNSLESCLMAQLYRGQTEVEDYSETSMTPPCSPTVRQFSVTRHGRSISRPTRDSSNLPVGSLRNKLQKDSNLPGARMILGVPQLPSVGSERLQQRRKTQTAFGMMEKNQQLQGFSHGALLFCLGMSIGLISSVLNNKREVDNLSNLLKQTESLVQDLQEELEMKDSLTVKELAVEDCESQDTQNGAFHNGPLGTCSPDEKLQDQLSENNTQKVEEESFSKIEAELEAELERLELNISSHGLDKKIQNLSEDADYVPHAVAGELNADILGQHSGPQPYADRDGSGSSTPRSVHYAVSPRELTLRLHELIQSRLEKRVEELEIALQNSQMKVQYMESQNASYLRELSSRRSRYYKNGSPVVVEESRAIADQPVVINLSEEALDDEYTKINELDEEDAPVLGKNDHKNEILLATEQKIYWARDTRENDEMQTKSFTERLMMSMKQEPGDADKYLSNGLLTVTEDHEDDINGYDEMEELLIKHIVEQARKGSPVVLNAQMALSSSPDEENEEHPR